MHTFSPLCIQAVVYFLIYGYSQNAALQWYYPSSMIHQDADTIDNPDFLQILYIPEFVFRYLKHLNLKDKSTAKNEK
ncbi:hypothetical protein DUZ99_03440 [Xylanibacillus composti]|uniref:Uncharacterized protein n=1 Tax=Xylanibacillus composti TaxID=1572762 RepID=A0A8J4H1X5_9BACL|nr:hypothetical protein [Xylanibacillus composti]GIQ69448.1 hypothetical protein XYCOK13_22720 [Xylanibacillus composti]